MEMEKASVAPANTEVQAFIDKWKKTEASELGNSQPFLMELCDLLKQPHPEGKVADESKNLYVFEKDVVFKEEDGTTSNGRIDLYKEGCFVLESKQGSERRQQEKEKLSKTPLKKRIGMAPRGTQAWRDAMKRAKRQAERYARALPEWPPFLIVVDVGFVFRLYADFKRLGKVYQQFPSPTEFEFGLQDLQREDIRELLAKIWSDPMLLDPEAKATKATKEVADQLARLARSLENDGHDPQLVAEFLMRLLFTMYAEDVGMLPRDSFTAMLKRHATNPRSLLSMLESLWTTMNQGGFSVAIEADVLEFNGQFFKDPKVLPLDEDQVSMLIETAELDWRDVEPAIFGTLIERALDPAERHKLGAHYTPRAYVERLVLPTIMQPLEDEWLAVQAAAAEKMHEAEEASDIKTRTSLEKKAVELIRTFHHKLLNTRVLDPACGSGNFLYVTFELMKRLESEVLQELSAITGLGGQIHAETEPLDPKNFLGIEINPRAAAVAELVLWLGFLKWHFTTNGNSEPRQPVLRAYHNIECRDAILDYDKRVPLVGDDGKPVTEWDGVSTKKHPVTGKDVPDETARRIVYDYINPRESEWPTADYVIGNPPFLGKAYYYSDLGTSYVKEIRHIYSNRVPNGADFVMYWWDKAAKMVEDHKLLRFGFVSTSTIKQSINRRVINNHPMINLLFTIDDHPWVDGPESAATRISMTVGGIENIEGTLLTVEKEEPGIDGIPTVGFKIKRGSINSDLSIGVNVTELYELESNHDLATMGPAPGSRGFFIEAECLQENGICNKYIKKIYNGTDLLYGDRGYFVVDLHGHDIDIFKKECPKNYQKIYNEVYPERKNNRDLKLRKYWYLFRRKNTKWRNMLSGLNNYIVTVETSKHRIFFILNNNEIAEHGIISFGLDGYYYFGILSSKIHKVFSLKTGGKRGETPRYNKTKCFDTFPFPIVTDNEKEKISSIAYNIEKQRNSSIISNKDVSVTDLYNIIEKLKLIDSGKRLQLTEKEKDLYNNALVGLLKQMHDELDAAVFDAYGWKHDLSDEEILERLVALNRERHEEEQNGTIRWLRPEFQAPKQTGTQQTMEVVTQSPTSKKKTSRSTPSQKSAFPKEQIERLLALRGTLENAGTPLSVEDITAQFKNARKNTVQELLELLVTLGNAHTTDDGRFAS